MGKDGFVDAQQSIYRATIKQSQLDKAKSLSDGGSPNGSKRKLKFDFSSTDIASSEVERNKQHEKHLKLIEDQMIQSKQSERALKRHENDFKKEQRQIRQAVREFDNRKL